MKKLSLLILVVSILFSCIDSGPLRKEIKVLETELKNCKEENLELKKTPKKRLLEAQKLGGAGKTEQAIIKYQEIIDKYPGSNEAETSNIFLKLIEEDKEEKRLKEERIKNLGFKVLKEKSTVEVDYLKLSFSNIKLSKNWYSDKYDETYHFREAIRGYKYLTATVKITSEINNPLLPPIYVYKLEDGKLKFISLLNYAFYKWKDYGSYLGNYPDYNNDFAHKSSVLFSVGGPLSNTDIKNSIVFLMVKRSNNIEREVKKYDNPPIVYTTGIKNEDFTIDLNKALDNFYVIKIFNKSKM